MVPVGTTEVFRPFLLCRMSGVKKIKDRQQGHKHNQNDNKGFRVQEIGNWKLKLLEIESEISNSKQRNFLFLFH